jgi:hypothetical protein
MEQILPGQTEIVAIYKAWGKAKNEVRKMKALAA